MTFFVQSFGCRASQADGSALEAALVHQGHALADGAVSADLVVLNSCTVTTTADADLRQTVRRVHGQNPAARIVITGCYAQRAPEEVAALPGVVLVAGNTHKALLPDLLKTETADAPYHGAVRVGDILAQHEFLAAPVEGPGVDRTRPNLKIQDGCGNRCAFCVIPFVRGHSRSAPAEQVVAQVRELGRRYREVVLTGINLGRWGREAGSTVRLADLLRRVLAETEVARLRLSSVEPMDWSAELLSLMAEVPRICPHVHAPLQSGSDAVLKRMRRKYRVRHYADRMERARALMPHCAWGADVMTGFPGETDAEFAETVAFIEARPFTYLHVFTYSERPGTEAVTLPGAVPVAERKRRTHVLRELGERKAAAFRRKMAGTVRPCVTLRERGWAITDNFLRVRLAREREPNELANVAVEAGPDGAMAERPALMVLP